MSKVEPVVARRALAPGQLLWLIALCLMLQPLSTDFYVASLPFIGDAFSASPAQIQNTLSFFAIGFGLAQLLVGPLADCYGRRPVLLGGLTVYVAASVLCALAWSMPALVVGRIGQALGCCAAVLIARTLIRDLYSLHEGARVMARASTILALGPLLGPIAGGYLQTWFGWRAAFVALAAFTLLLAIGAGRHLAETIRERNPAAIRLAGIAGAYREILATPAFWAYALPGSLSYASIFVFISGASMILVRGLGLPAHWVGYCFALGVSGYLLGTVVCQRWIRRHGVDAALGLGTRVAVGAGTGFLVLAALGLRHWAVVVAAQWLVMAAHGLTFPCAQTGAAAPFPDRAGAASGLSGFLAMACALAAGIVTAATFDGTLAPMAYISATLGAAIFGAAMLLRRHRRLGA